jgi:CheY-like chemotaxis protein
MRKLPIPNKLIEDFLSGRGLLWVGAGVSVGSGLPNWTSLIETLAHEVSRERDCFPADTLLRELDLLEIASVYEGVFGRPRLVEVLRRELRGRALDNPNLRKNATLRATAAFINTLWPDPGLRVVTTNYDSLLEDSLRDFHAKRATAVFEEEQLWVSNPKTDLHIVKLHGDLDAPSSITLTLSDYCEYRTRKRGMWHALSRDIAEKTVLFLGYGLSDFTFRTILGELKADRGQIAKMAYMITVKASPARRFALQEINVEVIDLDSHDEIPEALDRIKQGFSGITPQTVQAPEDVRDARVLFVDDDTSLVAALRDEFSRLGYKNFAAVSDGEEALRLVREQPFDAIVTDLMIGNGVGGSDVVSAARGSSINRRAIVACLTNCPENRVLEDGLDWYMQKPFKWDHFLSTFSRLRRLRDGSYLPV